MVAKNHQKLIFLKTLYLLSPLRLPLVAYSLASPAASFLGLAIDRQHNRILVVVHSHPPFPPFNAFAAYDLHSCHRLYLSSLSFEGIDAANDVAVDDRANVFFTNSGENFIWKVIADGSASIFSISLMYTAVVAKIEGSLGLNGIVYVSKGYLLVVQLSSEKVFKVDAVDGTTRKVLLNEDLVGTDDIAVRNDRATTMVSPMKELWLVKSIDNWAEGVVYDKVEVNVRRFLTSVVVGRETRVKGEEAGAEVAGEARRKRREERGKAQRRVLPGREGI